MFVMLSTNAIENIPNVSNIKLSINLENPCALRYNTSGRYIIIPITKLLITLSSDLEIPSIMDIDNQNNR